MTSTDAPARIDRSSTSPLPPVAWLPAGSAIATAVVVLAATSPRYGYHRDELYFRMLEPAWGYVDQPPLTPLLARAAAAVFGDTVWGMRIPAIACSALVVALTVLTTRELGGGRRAQALTAWGLAFASIPLAMGHMLLTATVDFALWAAVLLCIARALLRDRPRWWLAAGALVGLSLYNKLLIGLLLISLAVGLLLVGPRRVLRSPWLWAGVALALVIGSPNVIYQFTHDFPQLTMAAALAENNADDVRVLLVPFQLLLIGPTLLPIWVAGGVALLRRPEWRPLRAFAVGYLVLVVLSFIGGGQIYYPFGLLAFLLAAGTIPTVDWIGRARVALRRGLVVAAVALNAAVTTVIVLPILPLDVLGRTPIPEINQAARDQVGWPVYVRTLADVYAGLPPADRARAVLLTSNYGEAGALHRYGPDYGLPAVYSGQNQLFFHGPPPETATVVVAWTQAELSALFAACETKAVMDNGVRVDNEEQGSMVEVCRDPVGGWAAVWPRLQHYD